MVKELREKFNKKFTEEKYNNFLNDIWQITKGERDFRINETPLFLSDEFNKKLIGACDSIVTELRTNEFKEKSKITRFVLDKKGRKHIAVDFLFFVYKPNYLFALA